jgi:hypothetical protein
MKENKRKRSKETTNKRTAECVDWDTLDQFTLGYIQCALWSSHDYWETAEHGGRYLDEDYSIEDMATETFEEMKRHCAVFQEKCKDLLAEAGMDDFKAGMDFWLARNGFGVGYCDRDLGEVGLKLTEAAESWGEYGLYVGKDGKIRCPYRYGDV